MSDNAQYKRFHLPVIFMAQRIVGNNDFRLNGEGRGGEGRVSNLLTILWRARTFDEAVFPLSFVSAVQSRKHMKLNREATEFCFVESNIIM